MAEHRASIPAKGETWFSNRSKTQCGTGVHMRDDKVHLDDSQSKLIAITYWALEAKERGVVCIFLDSKRALQTLLNHTSIPNIDWPCTYSWDLR